LDVKFFPAVAGRAFARKGRQPYYVPHERYFEGRPGRAGENVVLELEASVPGEVKEIASPTHHCY
jgi:hypothetical protein